MGIMDKGVWIIEAALYGTQAHSHLLYALVHVLKQHVVSHTSKVIKEITLHT